jgi:hypothetical protein
LSESPETYCEGANKRLEELGDQIAKIETESKDAELTSRSYFDLRLKALGEQYTFAKNELNNLPKDEEFAHARQRLNYTINQLEIGAEEAPRKLEPSGLYHKRSSDGSRTRKSFFHDNT